jgi:hypothetical protein
MKYRQIDLNEESKSTIYKLVVNLVDSISDQALKDNVKLMFENINSRYFLTPYSQFAANGNCYEYGLAEYSIRFTKILKDLVTSHNSSIPPDHIVVMGLFHDVGKIGRFDISKPVSADDILFVPSYDEWRKSNLGEFYALNPIVSSIRYPVRSMQILNNFIRLSDLQYKLFECMINETFSDSLETELFLCARKIAVQKGKDKYLSWLKNAN